MNTYLFSNLLLVLYNYVYKLLKTEDQGLYPFINILKLYYTAVQSRFLIFASTLFIRVLSYFGNVKPRISMFLLVEGVLFIVRTFEGKTSPISAISLSESNSSHMSDTDLYIDPFMFIRVFRMLLYSLFVLSS